MGRLDGDKELPTTMDSINSLLNLQQFLSLPEIQAVNAQEDVLGSPEFDPAAANDDFLERMLSSVPASVFPWADDQPGFAAVGGLEEPPPAVVAPNARQQGLSPVEANVMMLQQQLLLPRGMATGNGPVPHGDQNLNDVVDGASFGSPNLNGTAIKALLNGFQACTPQDSIPSPFFSHPQSQGSAAAPIGSSSGASEAPPRQRVRARRGQATDPHSIAERLRRERIAERMKALQELVPNANKTDKASMLDEIIDYVKFLQLQVKVLSMSRLGSPSASAHSMADKPHQGPSSNGGEQTAPTGHSNGGLTVTEQQLARLMEEDMGAAMQFLQGKGLCLMPIALATAISASTAPRRNPLVRGEQGPSSPSFSALTVQSVDQIGSGGGEMAVVEDTAAAPGLI